MKYIKLFFNAGQSTFQNIWNNFVFICRGTPLPRSRVIFSAHRVTDRHGGTENPWTYQPHPPQDWKTHCVMNFFHLQFLCKKPAFWCQQVTMEWFMMRILSKQNSYHKKLFSVALKEVADTIILTELAMTRNLKSETSDFLKISWAQENMLLIAKTFYRNDSQFPRGALLKV